LYREDEIIIARNGHPVAQAHTEPRRRGRLTGTLEQIVINRYRINQEISD